MQPVTFCFTVIVFAGVTNSYVSNEYEKDNSKCPLGSVVTSKLCGRLGNNLWDYISILAVARVLPGKRQPYIRKYHSRRIRQYFAEPLLPIVEDIPVNCSYTMSLATEKEDKYRIDMRPLPWIQRYDAPGNVILHSPSIAVYPVMHEIDFIRHQLRFKPKIIEDANRIFDEIRDKTEANVTFVGVHVRRTDYIQYLKKREEVGAKFFNFAFEYFRNRTDLGRCVFLVVSDDVQWVKDNLLEDAANTDVYLVGSGAEKDPGVDLAVYSLCDHTVFDYGSFGLFGAVYAGGEVVTTSSYASAHPFILYRNFHFFDPQNPDEELTTLRKYHRPA